MVRPEFGIFGSTGGETSMGKEAQRAVVLNDEVRKKFDECVAALTVMRYGPEGPPEIRRSRRLRNSVTKSDAWWGELSISN